MLASHSSSSARSSARWASTSFFHCLTFALSASASAETFAWSALVPLETAAPAAFISCFSFSTDCVAAARNCSRRATILSWVSFFAAAKSSSAFFACTDNSASCSESGFTIAASFWSPSTITCGPTLSASTIIGEPPPSSRRAQPERQRDPGEPVENQIDPDEKADHPESRGGPLRKNQRAKDNSDDPVRRLPTPAREGDNERADQFKQPPDQEEYGHDEGQGLGGDQRSHHQHEARHAE